MWSTTILWRFAPVTLPLRVLSSPDVIVVLELHGCGNPQGDSVSGVAVANINGLLKKPELKGDMLAA